jgi:NADH-quinone oxidoreductase subunit M
VIFAAAYLLWAIQRILFQKLDKTENEGLADLSRRELLVLGPMLACIFWVGLYPAPFLRRIEPAARALITQVQGAAGAGAAGVQGASSAR